MVNTVVTRTRTTNFQIACYPCPNTIPQGCTLFSLGGHPKSGAAGGGGWRGRGARTVRGANHPPYTQHCTRRMFHSLCLSTCYMLFVLVPITCCSVLVTIAHCLSTCYCFTPSNTVSSTCAETGIEPPTPHTHTCARCLYTALCTKHLTHPSV